MLDSADISYEAVDQGPVSLTPSFVCIRVRYGLVFWRGGTPTGSDHLGLGSMVSKLWVKSHAAYKMGQQLQLGKTQNA